MTESNGGQSRNGAQEGTAAAWALLTITADRLEDTEHSRISLENQRRSLEQVKGLGPGSAPYDRLSAQLAVLADLEKMAVRDLRWALRQHPLGEWIADTHGLG